MVITHVGWLCTKIKGIEMIKPWSKRMPVRLTNKQQA